MANTGIFSSTTGILKLVTVLFGAIDLGLTASNFVRHASEEEYFLSIVIILFILSTILLFLAFLGILQEQHAIFDSIYHVIGGILLLIGAIVWFVSVDKYWDNFKFLSSGKTNSIRVAAGVFGLVNSLIYFVIGVLVYKKPRGELGIAPQ